MFLTSYSNYFLRVDLSLNNIAACHTECDYIEPINDCHCIIVVSKWSIVRHEAAEAWNWVK